MGLLPLVVDKLRQDSKLHDANMSKSTFGTKNVPAYSQFMFQYVYYCKQVYFQQEQSKLSGEIAFFSNLRKRGFQSGLTYSYSFSLINIQPIKKKIRDNFPFFFFFLLNFNLASYDRY